MRTYVNPSFIVILCILSLLFTSCGNKKDEGNMKDIFFYEYAIDDLKTLESDLTNEYDLNELRSFFEGSNANENAGFGSNTSVLMFNKVNLEYPVEIIRSGGYSVYRVSQGGYFYVFWVKPYSADINQTNIEPSVYFSAYLSSDISPTLFDSLIPGISTAEDVKKIDPSFELSFLRSNGIFSYSYLNNEKILQIEYVYNGNIDGYSDLIVKEKMVVSRTSAPSRYSAVLSSDLPD